jgi:7-cyano-7-deazaguanine synthase
MSKSIVVLSGGQDSTTCLFWALKQGFDVHAITFDYNQRHRREIEAAQKVVDVAHKYYPEKAIAWEVIELGPVLKGTSPLVSDNTLEQYKDHHSLPGGIEKTFVPMRNQLFLTIAMNRAVVKNASNVITGVCEEDYGGYPDCRQIFIDGLAWISTIGTFGDKVPESQYLVISTPLMKLTKKQTVELATTLPGCFEALAYTHTSYDGAYPPTGHDHATLLRAKGFEEANTPDPLILRAHKEGLMPLPVAPNYSSNMDDWFKRANL